METSTCVILVGSCVADPTAIEFYTDALHFIAEAVKLTAKKALLHTNAKLFMALRNDAVYGKRVDVNDSTPAGTEALTSQ